MSGSLIERAARAYDFGSCARRPAGRPAAPDRLGEEGAAPRGTVTPLFAEAREEAAAAKDTLALIPAEFLSGADPDDVVAPDPGGEARVDRGLLAERGMIVPGAPVGPLAEEFRLVKRHLLGTGRLIAEAGDGERARTVLVNSARPGEGKTFCAINLALSLAAERDTQVLLVDADFAKPDVLRQLGLERDRPGLLDALDDEALDPEQLVIATDVPGLSVLPAGTHTAADTELLASRRTRAVIARLLEAPGRVILFDSPPALAASPAGVLAGLAGQVLLVVRADRTAEGEVRQAVGLLNGCERVQLLLNARSYAPGGHRFGDYYGQDGAP